MIWKSLNFYEIEIFSMMGFFKKLKLRNGFGYIYCFVYEQNVHIAKGMGKIVNLELIFVKIKYYL
jgi:hypothetical protein